MSNIFSSESDEESEQQIREVRHPRIFKQRINNDFAALSAFQFNEKFRISKCTAEYILSKIGRNLQHPTKRNHALDAKTQVLCALHWLGSGAQYHVVGDGQGVSKNTIQRCVKRFCNLIVEHLMGEEIRWPSEDIISIPQRFRHFGNFTCVAGIVDGSLIRIDAPNQNESAFVDRNGDHSINAMFVCGPNLEFFYVSARWPGSVHDARVLRNSSLARRWENGWRPFPNALILGDSGYGRKSWLITPVIPPQIEQTEALQRFLKAHKKTRRLVENALGILKEKFPCLNYMRLEPATACKVVLTCTILHNLEIRSRETPYEIMDDNDDADEVLDSNEEDVSSNVDEVNELTSISVFRTVVSRFS